MNNENENNEIVEREARIVYAWATLNNETPLTVIEQLRLIMSILVDTGLYNIRVATPEETTAFIEQYIR